MNCALLGICWKDLGGRGGATIEGVMGQRGYGGGGGD